MHLSRAHPAAARVLGGLAAAGLVAVGSPAQAMDHEGSAPNPREVPNAACGQDTPQAGFPDRDAAAVTHRRSIDCVAHLGVAEGRGGAYHPHETVTRGQMASFVARSLEAAGHQLPPPTEQGFQDIDDSVHRDRIRQLAAAGIVQGRSEDRYDPGGTVTRAQMASYVTRAASWAHDHAYRAVGDDAYFLDIQGNVHAESIRAGYELYLFEGTAPGQYAPHEPVRRDAMATFLTRAIDLVHTGERQSTHQTYVVTPQEPLTLTPGEQADLGVLGRYDDVGGDVRQSLHLALFPCAAVDIETLPATFTDADGNGLADRIGSTDTGQAYIDTVNGQPTAGQPRLVPNAAPQSNGTIEFTVVSPAADCTVPAVFDDRAPTDELRVDARGLAANPYGIAEVTWR